MYLFLLNWLQDTPYRSRTPLDDIIFLNDERHLFRWLLGKLASRWEHPWKSNDRSKRMNMPPLQASPRRGHIPSSLPDSEWSLRRPMIRIRLAETWWWMVSFVLLKIAKNCFARWSLLLFKVWLFHCCEISSLVEKSVMTKNKSVKFNYLDFQLWFLLLPIDGKRRI